MSIHSRLKASVTVMLASLLSACVSSTSLPTQAPIARADATRRASKNALLYSASNYYGGVTIYTFPQGQEVASFNVPGGPSGLCSDSRGDVFIAEPYGKKVEEYAHGATSPMATFDYSPNPYGCALDNTSKYLAVAGGAGSVGIFDLSKKKSKPTNYTYSGVQSFFFCTYDDQGNLFVDGTNGGGINLLLELRKGQASLRLVKLGFKMPYSATVQWDGAYLAIYAGGNNNYLKVLRVKVDNYRAKIHARVVLKSPEPFTSQLWIQGNSIISPVNRSADLAWWSYPAGGKPTGTISGGEYLFGVTVSVAPSL
jgi:hypothetical protein